MAPQNRAALIAATFKVLKKTFRPAPNPPERSILEHWIYGCCLENARYEDADIAFTNITAAAFDWNEMRVTTISELAEQMSALTNPRDAAARVKRTLQSVFESRYTFDLEPLSKQNLGKTIKDMLRLHGTTPFSVSYVVQHALGGHSIPLDRGVLDALLILGVIDEKERENGVVPGLERAIPKKNGISDGSLLHQLGAELVKSPFSPQVRELLLSINPEAQARLPKRQRKKKPEPEPEPIEEEQPIKKKANGKKSKDKEAATKSEKALTKKTKTPKEEAPPTKKPAGKTTKQQSAGPKPPAGPKSSGVPAKKKKTTSKKSTSKQLTKRKPR